MAKIKEKIFNNNNNNNKGKTTHNIKQNPHKAVCGFLSRNTAGQEGVARYIKSDGKEEPKTKNTHKGSHSDPMVRSKAFKLVTKS